MDRSKQAEEMRAWLQKALKRYRGLEGGTTDRLYAAIDLWEYGHNTPQTLPPPVNAPASNSEQFRAELETLINLHAMQIDALAERLASLEEDRHTHLKPGQGVEGEPPRYCQDCKHRGTHSLQDPCRSCYRTVKRHWEPA